MRIWFSVFYFILFIHTKAQLIEIPNFGTNPGNLTMYVYIPSVIHNPAPLVVVLHGCNQTAQEFSSETGWNDLADEYGFIVLYPEQKILNNLNRCFNWFNSEDYTKNSGENLSILQMIDYSCQNYAIDSQKTYIAGLSAGGGMTSILMANYPNKIRKAAIFSGLPYRAANSSLDAIFAMNPGYIKTPSQWGDLVRLSNPFYSGKYPELVVFHGSLDVTVASQNMQEIVKQWTNVHSTTTTPSFTETPFFTYPNVNRAGYENTWGDTVVLTYQISNLGHGISVDPGINYYEGGLAGTYTFDKNFYSTFWAAEFFDLLHTPVQVKLTQNTLQELIDVRVNNRIVSIKVHNIEDDQQKFEAQVLNIQGVCFSVHFDKVSKNQIEGLYEVKYPGLYIVSLKMDKYYITRKIIIL